MAETKIKTKFGNATICNDGYYHITSRKEGNNGKKLSRLVFEDFYNITLPTNIHIHHVDGNRTNDNIWNLIPMRIEEHSSHHHKGREYSDDFKINISKTKNNTGFFRVLRVTTSETFMGYKWMYKAKHHEENTVITSVSLLDLKEKVLSKGFRWEIIDEKLAEESRQKEIEYFKVRKQSNSSGIHNVYKNKDKTCKQGFNWVYRFTDENGKPRYLTSVDLDKLKQRVLSKGFKWIVFDEEIKKVEGL